MANPGKQPMFDLSAVLREAWELYTRELTAWLLLGTVFFVSYMVASLTCVGIFFVFGPLFAGLHVAAFKQLRGEKPEVGDIFAGFHWFGATCMAGLLYLLGVSVGFLLCIIPGFILMIWWMFAIPLCASHNMGAMDALARSKEMVSRSFTEFLVFGLVIFLIQMVAGVVPFGQFLVGYPLTTLMVAILIRDLYGLEGALPRTAPVPPPPPAAGAVPCPRCNAPVAQGTRFCTSCGGQVA
ncbi:MAG: hypothetical protein HUU15_08345 [Candidatus Brocadiae bacterium]|nr:hypothetical protein [Candidatus Brocadiia bacterium]